MVVLVAVLVDSVQRKGMADNMLAASLELVMDTVRKGMALHPREFVELVFRGAGDPGERLGRAAAGTRSGRGPPDCHRRGRLPGHDRWGLWALVGRAQPAWGGGVPAPNRVPFSWCPCP